MQSFPKEVKDGMEDGQCEIKAARARLQRSQMQMKSRDKKLCMFCLKSYELAFMWVSITDFVMSHYSSWRKWLNEDQLCVATEVSRKWCVPSLLMSSEKSASGRWHKLPTQSQSGSGVFGCASLLTACGTERLPSSCWIAYVALGGELCLTDLV